MSEPVGADDDWSAGETAGFIDPVSMEEDPAELFAGDAGTLDADVRRVLVQLLRRKFLSAEKNPAQWRTTHGSQCAGCEESHRALAPIG